MTQNAAVSALFDQEPTLASPPEVYFEVTRALNHPATNYEHIAALLEKDPSLTARLLKLVNSSLYYRNDVILSVASAIGVIGLGPLSDLVLATVIKNRFDALFEGGPSLLDFWIRSIRRAVIARDIAVFLKATQDASPVFISGLLLDIGELVLAAAAPDRAREVTLASGPDAPPIHVVETSVLGFNRYDVGQELARRWVFPPLIGEAMSAVAESPHASLVSEPVQLVQSAHQLTVLGSDDQDLLRETFPAGFEMGEKHLAIEDYIETLLTKVDEHFGDIFYLFYN